MRRAEGENKNRGRVYRARCPNRTLRSSSVTGVRASAVLAPLYVHDDVVHVVLTRRAQNLRSHHGEVSFPGGGEERWGLAPLDRPICFFEVVGDTIWGATAAMLRNLLTIITRYEGDPA